MISLKTFNLLKILGLYLLLAIVNVTFALEEVGQYYQGKTLKVPLREIALIVDDMGVYPQRMTAFAGEKVRFFVTNMSSHPSCVIISDKELFLEAKKGAMSQGEAYFEKAGVYRFKCPGYPHIQGRLTVLNRPKRGDERAPASLMKKKKSRHLRVWMPAELPNS